MVTAPQTKTNITELWIRYKNNQDTTVREDIILFYLPLVKYVVGRMAGGLPEHYPKEDLTSYGILGLIDAVEKFDPERGIKFETYALTRIKGAIWDGLRSEDWLPSSVRQKAKKIEQAYQKIEHQLGRQATDEEVAAELNITLAEFQRQLVEIKGITLISLEDLLPGQVEQLFNENRSHSPYQIDILKDHPEISIEFKEMKEILVGAIALLPEKEKLVVTLYYYEGLTLKEIGQVMELSESRISQLHTKAILRLRGKLSRRKKLLVD